MKPTDEQQRVIDAIVAAGNAVQKSVTGIIAFAGTGKTTTLCAGTLANPDKYYLYLAYNKAAQQSAEKKFPTNCACRTIHSLAYRLLDTRYAKRSVIKMPRLREVIDFLSIKRHDGLSAMDIASTVVGNMQKFYHSTDPDPVFGRINLKSLGNKADNRYQDLIGNYMTTWWYRIRDPDGKCDISMDALLKLFYLSNPDLSEHGYDAILLDEAQDSDPITIGILARQNISLVFVGDMYQQLYSYRGAVNAMDRLQPDQTFYLTGSFRFGSEIAKVANRVLKALESPHLVKGLGKQTGSYGAFEKVVVDRSKPYAFLARTNAGVIAEALRLAQMGKKCYLGSDPAKIIDHILSVWALRQNKRDHIVDKQIKRYHSVEELKESAEANGDQESLVSMRIVEEYGPNLPARIRLLKQCTVSQQREADVLLTTCHRAKGLEWKNVVIGDDFKIPKQREDPKKWAAEMNLAYVAVTRAKERIDISPSASVAIAQCSALQPLLYPGMSQETKTEGGDKSSDQQVAVTTPPPQSPAHDALMALQRGALAVGKTVLDGRSLTTESVEVPTGALASVKSVINEWYASHGLDWPYPVNPD